MSDIFISYSSADRPRAALVAQALAARGWSIWWDRTIPPGRQFDDVIEEALDAARCVVVLWSKASAASSWVRNEASAALQRKALIPALIDIDVKIPLEFRRLQAADLTRWNGEPSTPEFDQFCDAIASEVGPAGSAPAVPSPAPFVVPAPARHDGPAIETAATVSVPPAMVAPASAAPPRSKKAWYIGGAVVLLLGVIGALNDRRDIDPNGSNDARTSTQRTDTDSTGDMGRAAISPAQGIHTNLVWHDYVLAYSGSVSWDGRSDTAFVRATVADSNTRQIIGTRELTAAVMQTGPAQIVFSTSVAVPGDSRTPGPHSHNVNLVFENQGGTWQFMRNCMAPNNCY